MIVTRSSFDIVLSKLLALPVLGLDTETTGLRPYHGDRLFSIIIAHEKPLDQCCLGPDDSTEQYYFNFLPYEGLDPESVLLPSHLDQMRELFRQSNKKWYIHKANYDQSILAQEGIFLAGEIHCTKAIALVEYNEHQDYTLASCGERIGVQKDRTVERYIAENKLTEKRQGATQAYTHQFYDRVPVDLIVPYALKDADIHYRLGRHQETAVQRTVDATKETGLPSLQAVFENEKRLTRTVFRMEHLGVRIDRPYCVRAARYEADRAEKALQAFKASTGRALVNSTKCFSEVFASEKDKWVWGEPTKKTGQVNPSFESEVLQSFANPAAKAVLEYRDAISKRNFYNGFLYHADEYDNIHPNFNQDGAGHGRFSSSNPNLQNLTSEEGQDLEAEFVVRRAIIPRPGFVFIMPDYDQMEYRMMFDVACSLAGYESAVVKEIKNGKDPHQATADIVTALGTPLSRSRAKNGNFAFLYGSGYKTLAKTIGASIDEARTLKAQLSKACPEVADYIGVISRRAERRRFIINWLGRRCHFPNPDFSYCAPNYHIAGGCADVVKVVMNRLDDLFLERRSRMVLTIHDELPIEVHESEVATVPREVKEIMESVYPWKYLPLTAGMEWSDKSLADKKKGFPA